MHKINITHVNNAHNDWLRALDFYKQEISIMKQRLTEIAGKNTVPGVGSKVEHFENQFKVQRDNIDRLEHHINLNIKGMSNELQNGPTNYVDDVLLAKHNTLGQQYQAEEKTINELRQEFNHFATEWM